MEIVSMQFFMALGSIILLDILLGGDNAVVIVDGILVDSLAGKSRIEALTTIGRKTAIPLLGATLIAILAFLPIYLSPDVTGLYVRDMFIVLAVSLFLSWMLALMFVPILAKRWLVTKEEQTPQALYNSRWHRMLANVLNKSLYHRKLTVSLMLLLLLAAVLGYQLMPQGLFPDMTYDQLYIEYQLPEGHDPRQVKSDLESMRKKLMAKDYVTHVTTSVGATPCRYNLVRSVALPSLSYGELIVDFKDAHTLDRHIDELQEQLTADYPDAYVKVKKYNLMFMRYPIELRFLGPDPEVLHQLADTAMAIVRKTGVMDPVTSDWMPRYPSLRVAYNQPSARDKGMTRSDVGLSLMSATDGLPVGVFYSGTEKNNIYVNIMDSKGQPQASLDDATVFSMLPDINKFTDKEIPHNWLR